MSSFCHCVAACDQDLEWSELTKAGQTVCPDMERGEGPGQVLVSQCRKQLRTCAGQKCKGAGQKMDRRLDLCPLIVQKLCFRR